MYFVGNLQLVENHPSFTFIKARSITNAKGLATEYVTFNDSEEESLYYNVLEFTLGFYELKLFNSSYEYYENSLHIQIKNDAVIGFIKKKDSKSQNDNYF